MCSLVVCLAMGAAAIEWAGPGRMEPGIPLLACRALYFVPGLTLGRLYAARLADRDTLPSGRYFAAVTLAQLLLLYASNGDLVSTPSWAEFPHGAVITLASAATGIAFWWRVCRLVAPHLSDGAKRVVWALSDGSFSIMCFHMLGSFLLSTLFGAVAAVTPLFGLWDSASYLAYGGYVYLPHDVRQFALLYVVFSICFSLGLHAVWNRLRVWVGERRKALAS